ncbi:hypothetical protein DM860_012883 [Cuscuta australis]|uniref:Cyclic nucleotide-binding domain-containing protein n=1 Tax=Cuscuta australis TaxID=267555 RepID=A0A328DW53_9ASTE|nr:hypothetical protein DM860_012883 [Cuscuta australis]
MSMGCTSLSMKNESILNGDLPTNPSRNLRRHLSFELSNVYEEEIHLTILSFFIYFFWCPNKGFFHLHTISQVPIFSKMENKLLDALRKHMVSRLSMQGTYNVREGDPGSKMVFIVRGKLDSSTTDRGRTRFFNTITLGPEISAWMSSKQEV